jgi:hypothetical protein
MLGETNGPADGAAYEYLVGISLAGKDSQPDSNTRFIDWNRLVFDEEFLSERQMTGFALPRPKMISVSRTVNEEGGRYYEIVKWEPAGIDPVGSDIKNRGVAGYDIEVRNQAGEWKSIKKVFITTDADKEKFEFEEKAFNDNGLLNVLRDYRHYFRVRAFAASDVYSREPPSPTFNGSETDYVKWGARQISAKEFAALTSLAIGTGLYGVGPSQSDSYKTGTVTLSNKTALFGTVNGTLKLKTTANAILGMGISFKTFDKYGATNGGDSESTITFTADPADVPFNYSGTVKIKGMTASAGTYRITFNGQTDESMPLNLVTAPFTFGTATFKSCDGLVNWNETAGWQ